MTQSTVLSIYAMHALFRFEIDLPTTAMRCARWGSTGTSFISLSYPAVGFTKQEERIPLNVKSKHAWLQPIHVFISAVLFSAALLTKWGSAKNGPVQN